MYYFFELFFGEKNTIEKIIIHKNTKTETNQKFFIFKQTNIQKQNNKNKAENSKQNELKKQKRLNKGNILK